MKNKVINGCMNYIKKNTNYDEVKLKEIKYGLEGIYLTITKLIVIFSIATILGIVKELIIYMIIYNFIRMPSFGLHATKSWICLISSTILFIGIPYLCIILDIPIIVKSIICIIGIYLMYKNSPADTYKRPIINKKRREIYKTLSTILTIIYSFIAIFIDNSFISNCFIFAIIMQNGMISPTVYRIFGLPYNNYIKYLKDHPEYVY